jgi:GxxExxY protein
MIFDEALRLDVLVEDLAICELKAVDEMNPVWKAQILSHLKQPGSDLGFLSILTCLSSRTASTESYYDLCVLVSWWQRS